MPGYGHGAGQQIQPTGKQQVPQYGIGGQQVPTYASDSRQPTSVAGQPGQHIPSYGQQGQQGGISQAPGQQAPGQQITQPGTFYRPSSQ